jgi:hypothetical protein
MTLAIIRINKPTPLPILSAQLHGSIRRAVASETSAPVPRQSHAE